MTTATYLTHIDVDELGVARIGGTRHKVKHLVLDKLSWGSTPEEMVQNYSDLSLDQIHAAFAYYYENRDVIDAQNKADEEYADRLARESSDPGRRARLVARLKP